MRWRKLQRACREAPCSREGLTEQIPQLPAGGRVTARLRCHVAGRVAAGLRSASPGTIRFAAYVVQADGALLELGR